MSLKRIQHPASPFKRLRSRSLLWPALAPTGALLANCFSSTAPPPPDDSFVDSGAGDATVPIDGAAPLDATPALPDVWPDALPDVGDEFALSEDAGFQLLTASPPSLDFGSVLCGQSAAGATVTLTNGNAFPVPFTATLAAGAASPFSIDVASGTVPANGASTVHVTPQTIPVPATLAANAYGDTLTVAPSVPSVAPMPIPLTESAAGAVLAVTATTTHFSGVDLGASGSLAFTVTNSGNRPASVTASAGASAPFAASLTPATVTANGGTSAGTVTFTPAQSSSTVSTAVTVTTTDVLCAAPPAPLTFDGVGQQSVASYPGTTLSFDETCGSTSKTNQVLTIENTGAEALTISGVTTTARFQVVSSPSSIAPGMSGSITVAAITPVVGTDLAGNYTGTLSFKTNEVGAPTHAVPLAVAIHGANVSLVDANGAPLPVDSSGYPTFSMGSCDSEVLYMVNTGDQGVQVTGNDVQPYTGGDISTVACPASEVFSGTQCDVFAPAPLAAGGGPTQVDLQIATQFAACPGVAAEALSVTGPVCVAPATLDLDLTCTCIE